LNSSEQRNYLVSNAFLALASLPLILLSPIGTFFASAGALNSFNLKEMSIVCLQTKFFKKAGLVVHFKTPKIETL
jgi:hypothetical protein